LTGAKVHKNFSMSTLAIPLTKNYIDRKQFEQIAVTCDLWVTVAPNRLSLFAVSKVTNSVAGLTVLELADHSLFTRGLFELRSWLEGLELYGIEYKNTHIIFENPEFTIVPQVLFATEKAELLLSSVMVLPKFYSIRNSRIDLNQSVNVYAVPDIFCSTLKVLFPQATVHHYNDFLLQANLILNDKAAHCLYIHLHDTYLDAMHIHEQELKFANTFAFEADTDVIYFILSVAEQQKIAIEKLHLVVMGEVNANGALLQLLKKYVPQVDLYKRNENFSYPASFREFQDHQYFIQSAILLCE
jgi:hypothetical protein